MLVTKRDSTNDLGLYDYTVQFVVDLGLLIPTIESLSNSLINNLRSNLVTKGTVLGQVKLKELGIGVQAQLSNLGF